MSVGAALRPLVDAYAVGVPEIAARLAGAGLGAAAGDAELARLPLLRKSALARLQADVPPWGGMLAEGFVPAAAFLSSGGVVEPLVPRMVERLAELLRAAGFGAGHTVLNGFGYHVTPAGMLFHEALVRTGCTVLPGGPQNTATLVDYARTLGATAFVGIASHLKILFDEEPRLAIRLAMAGAEPHGDAVRALLAERHGVRCVDMYGFAEGGIVAASCAAADALHLHADVTPEVLDPASGAAVEPGEAGELVVSLDNPGFPLLRFATGDLVEIDAAACPCGRRGVLRVLGRTGESVRVKGMLLHASQLRQFLGRTGLDACTVVVTREADRDRIAVSVRPGGAASPGGVASPEVDRPHTPLDTASVAAAFRESCRLGADRIDVDPGLAVDSCTFEDRRRS